MFLNHYEDSQNYETIPGYEKLNDTQRAKVHEAFERGYNSGKCMGIKIALGKGFETAKLVVQEQLKASVSLQPAPTSIFDGLENCK